MKFSLVQHGVKVLCYYDQTIEDLNIFSPAFWLSRGGWLNLPGGSTYPTLPYQW